LGIKHGQNIKINSRKKDVFHGMGEWCGDGMTAEALVSFKKYMPPSSSLLQGKHLPFTLSPLRLNIFCLFVILSLTQLYRIFYNLHWNNYLYFKGLLYI
jgi:hypothetical protein